MHIEFDQTVEDLAHWQRFVSVRAARQVYRQPVRWRTVGMVVALILGAGGYVLWTAWETPVGQTRRFEHEVVGAVLVFLAGALSVKAAALWHVARSRQLRDTRTPEHSVVMLTAEHVADAGAEAELRLRWGAVTEVTDSPEAIYLPARSGLTIVIPKRAFPDPAAAQAFLALARQYHQAAQAGAAKPGV